jgi:TonB family protein
MTGDSALVEGDSRTRYPFLKAFACGGVLLAGILVTFGLPGSNSEAQGELFGKYLFALFVPSIIAGILARKSSSGWRLWKIVAVYAAIVVPFFLYKFGVEPTILDTRRQVSSCVTNDPVIRECNPKDANAYDIRGNAYYANGDLDRAIAAYSEAIRLDPNDATAYNNRGIAYDARGEFDRAIADYNEAVRLDPKDAVTFNNRGETYRHKGDFDRAIADYNEAVRLDHKLSTAYGNRGTAYYAKGDLDRAIADYDQAVRLDPKDATAYNNRGIAYDARGDFDRAIADYSEAIRLNSKDAVTFSNRADTYRHKGDFDRAIADYNEAFRLDPKLAPAYGNRGNAYYAKGDLDRAIADYDQAVRLDPKDATAYNNRGIAYDARGDHDRAIADYNEAWQTELVAHIEQFKRYPSQARAEGEQGIIKVAFTIDHEGQLLTSRIVESSGSAELDQETLDMLTRAQPMPKPPRETKNSELSFVVPVRFYIR